MPKVHSDGHDIDLHVYYIDLCLGSIDEDSCSDIGKRCVCVSERSSLSNLVPQVKFTKLTISESIPAAQTISLVV